MAYRSVLIYEADGAFIGYAIHQVGAQKLQSTNVYFEDETDKLRTQLDRLNEGTNLAAVWPDARDLEVVAILNDETFMPLEMAPTEVVDDEHSLYVYNQEYSPEENRWIDGATINEEASVIRFKTILAPVRPSDVMERQKAAMEIVARKRAGIA